MKKTIILLILFIFFITLLTPSTIADEEIDTDLVKRYAEHLIFIYNEKADKDRDFDVEAHKDEMCLYMDNNDNLRVLCFLGNVDNDSIIFFFDKNPYDFSFTGIKVDFLFEYDVYSYFPFYIPKNISVYSQATFRYNDTVISPELVRCSSFEDIFYYTEHNSMVLAEKIYDDNKKSAKINEILMPFAKENWGIISNDYTLNKTYFRIYSHSAMDNYSFDDFLQDFNKFKDDVLWKKYSFFYIFINDDWNGYSYTILFTFIISFIIFLLESKKISKKYLKLIKEKLGVTISLLPIPLYGYYWILIPEFEWYKLIPLSPIIIYGIVITKRYNKNKSKPLKKAPVK